MADKKEKTVINANGEPIFHRADGEKFVAHGHSPVRDRHMAATPDRQERHAQLVEVKHGRVAAKKSRQQSKGWPSDKSPI